jgi:1,4-alpha-glucan branching enzyme
MPVNGYLALILHAHLPYVRHPEHENFLEEDWLYEAITETYLPLLDALYRMADDGVPFALTLSLTPPLCHMLRDPLLQERATRHLERTVSLARSEMRRTDGNDPMHAVVSLYHDRLIHAQGAWEDRWKRDLVGAFGALQERGVIEIITCAATHGFLPLMEMCPETVRAQIRFARQHYRDNFARNPGGIWLPECAYFAGLDEVLAEEELRWFVLDSHGLMFGTPRPRYAVFAPCFTPAGPRPSLATAIPRVRFGARRSATLAIQRIATFYRDVGFDLSEDYLRPFLGSDGQRKFTGLKYYRITGRSGGEKELYRRKWALAAVEAHASHFMAQRAHQVGELRNVMNFDPIVVSPFDAELFGHWWFEGIEWLELFVRKAAYDQKEFTFTTPGRYLDAAQYIATGCAEPIELGKKGILGSLARRRQLLDLSASPHLRTSDDRARAILFASREATASRSTAPSSRWLANSCSHNPVTGPSS